MEDVVHVQVAAFQASSPDPWVGKGGGLDTLCLGPLDMDIPEVPGVVVGMVGHHQVLEMALETVVVTLGALVQKLE